MKKIFYYMSLLLGFVFGMTMFTACGGDDDDDGGSGGSSDLAQLDGIYSGTGNLEGDELTIVIDFDGKGNSEYTFYAYFEDYGQMPIEECKNSTYTYDSGSGTLKLYDNDNNTYISWVITNLSSSSFQLYQEKWNTTLNMSRTGNSAIKGKKKSSSGSSSSGSGSSDSGSSSKTKCPYCLGSGDCHNYKTSSANKIYCGGDGKCYNCNGKGWYYGIGYQKVNCPNCDSPGYNSSLIGSSGRLGDGKCAKCHGSGKCQNCGGKGDI